MDAPNGGLYYKATGSGRKRCNPGSLQQIVQNDIFCSNNRRDISKRFGKVVQRQRVEATPESVVLDRGPQFVVELTKKLNQMLGIKTKLSTAFHP